MLAGCVFFIVSRVFFALFVQKESQSDEYCGARRGLKHASDPSCLSRCVALGDVRQLLARATYGRALSPWR